MPKLTGWFNSKQFLMLKPRDKKKHLNCSALIIGATAKTLRATSLPCLMN